MSDYASERAAAEAKVAAARAAVDAARRAVSEAERELDRMSSRFLIAQGELDACISRASARREPPCITPWPPGA